MSTICPELSGRQGGFAIVAALFILVVLAALGGYLASTSSTQHLTLAKDAMNARAAQAARAGIEWATYQATRALPGPAFRADCLAAAAPANNAAAPAALSFAVGELPAISDFRVDMEVRWWRVSEGADSYCVYNIVATACNAAACPSATPGIGYAEHQQMATVRQ